MYCTVVVRRLYYAIERRVKAGEGEGERGENGLFGGLLLYIPTVHRRGEIWAIFRTSQFFYYMIQN